MRRVRNFIIRVAAVGGVLAGWTLSAAAGVKVEPSAFKLSLAEGGTQSERLWLSNESDTAVTLLIQPEYWFQGACRQPVTAWLKISPSEITLPARSQGPVSLEVDLPERLSGECVAMLYLAQKPQGGTLAIQTRMGVPVYLRPRDSGRPSGKVSAFSLDSEPGPFFKIGVQNTGDLHVLPFGSLSLTDATGRTFHREMRFVQPVFPGQTRDERAGFDPGRIPEGRYRARVDLFLDTLYTEAPGTIPAISAETTVWVRGWENKR